MNKSEMDNWSLERLKFEYEKKKQEARDERDYAERKYAECVADDLPMNQSNDFINTNFKRADDAEREVKEIEEVLREKL